MLVEVSHKFALNPKVPMIRLKIDHADYEVISAPRITQFYTTAQIANLSTCLQFRRKKELLNKALKPG